VNRCVRTLFPVGAVFLFNACYLISPNVNVKAPTKQDNAFLGSGECADAATAPSDKSNLGDHQKCAVNYANNARAEYARAGNLYSTVPGVLETAAIPVGAAALALGIEGYSGAPITGLGVGAASLFGFGTLYQHKDRESVYVTGANAIDCLLTNMQPFTNVTTANLSELEQTLYGSDGLVQAKGDLERKIAAYARLQVYKDCRTDSRGHPLRTQAERDAASAVLKAADAADKAAQTALQSGADFLGTTYSSPGTIVYTVYSINDGVTKALISTEPDVQSLAGTMKGVIPDAANSLAGIKATAAAGAQAKSALSAAPSPTAANAAGFQARAPSSEEELYDDLYNAAEKVNSLVADVGRVIGNATKPPDNKACVALTAQAKEVKVLTLKPSGDVKVSPGGTGTVAVKGVTTKADIYPLFAQSSALKSEVTANLSDDTVNIAVTSDTAPGFYPFVVMDGPTGAPFTVFVVKKQEEQFAASTCAPTKKTKSKLRARKPTAGAGANGAVRPTDPLSSPPAASTDSAPSMRGR
jgi:hypothetical protein